MAYRINRGLGRTPAQDAECRDGTFGGFFTPACWSMLEPSPLAPPQSPVGDVLTVPPASGEQAQATVDALLNQQLADQQALNASQVSSSWWDSLTGGTYGAVASVASGVASFPWVLIGVIGVGMFALVAMSGGSPRRYGR